MFHLSDDKLAEIRAGLRENIQKLATELLGDPSKARSSQREWRWPGAFKVTISGDDRGLWYSFGENIGGDPIGLIKRERRCSFIEAIRWAAAWLGIDIGQKVSLETVEERQKRLERRQREAERRTALAQQEAARSIAEAQALWAGRMPLEGTPAFVYLTAIRGIPEPAGGFPVDIAWHPGERALIVAARSPSGIVTAVQVVRLTAQGHKRTTAHLVKQTYGKLQTDEGRSVVRLPARFDARDDLLQHAEGPETALAALSSTGIETWAALGPNHAPQPDRFNIILADDDAAESKRAIAFRQQQMDWTRDGVPFVVATPWEKPRGDTSDFANVIVEAGPQGVWDRIDTAVKGAVGVAPAAAPRALPSATLQDARAYLNRVGREFFLPAGEWQVAPQVLVTSEGGVGKTDMVGRMIPEASIVAEKAGRPHRTMYLIPEHAVLGAQVTERFTELGLEIAHLKGRGDPFNPKPDDLCQNPEAVKLAILAAQPIKESCCGVGCPIADKGACAHLAALKKAEEKGVVVMAHNHLTQQLPKKIREDVGAIVIDENSIPLMDWNFTVTTDMFSEAALQQWPVLKDNEVDPDGTRLLGWTHAKLRAAYAAYLGDQDIYAALKAAGLDRDEICAARKLEWRREREAKMTPGMPLEQRREVAEAAAINSKLPRIAAVYDALESVLTDGEAGAGRVEVRVVMGKDGAKHELVVHIQHHLAAWTNDLPVMMLNSTAKIEDVRRFFPRTVERKGPIVATPHNQTVQILGGFSKGSMRSAKKLADARAFLTVAFPGQNTGIIGHKSSVGAFADLPQTKATWHGANAGDDSMRTVDVGVVFDGPRAPAAEIAALARARTGRRVEVANPVMSTETVLMSDGTGVSIPVLRYEDPAAQAVHESIHHAAVGQALARPRQVLRTATNPSITLLFGNVTANMPVDVIIQWADAKPDRLVHMKAADRICLNAKDMCLWHDKLFKSVKASSTARERFGNVMERIEAMIARDPRPFSRVQFQPAGQGQNLHMIICPTQDVAQLRNEAEKKYGKPMVHWSVSQMSHGRKDIPNRLQIDLRAMGMTSGPIPAVVAGSLSRPPNRLTPDESLSNLPPPWMVRPADDQEGHPPQ